MLKRNSLVRIVVLSSLILLIAAACSKDDKNAAEDAYKVVSEGTLAPGDEIPVPENPDDIILTVTGKISHPNQGDSIVMDMAAIESMQQVEYTVPDPFEEADITYRGVLMSSLLELWGVDEDATTLTVAALNDYQSDVPIDGLRKYPVIFAVKKDGEYMPIDTRGPAMLIYPYHKYEFDQEVVNNYWVWQIKSIEAK